jgi:hypothetical protein
LLGLESVAETPKNFFAGSTREDKVVRNTGPKISSLTPRAMRVRDAREKRLRDNSVETSVKHFKFNANWRKLFGELGQIFLTETILNQTRKRFNRRLTLMKPNASRSLAAW